MGQRLNIEIMMNEKVLANAYYHWSGYTRSAIELTKIILKEFHSIEEENPGVRAIRLLEKTDAGLTPEEITYLTETFGEEYVEEKNFKDAKNRNDGLISVSQNGIESTRYYEEGRVTIHLDSELIDFNVCCFHSLNEDEEEDEEEIDQSNLQKPTIHLPKNIEDFDQMTFEYFEKFANGINSFIESGEYCYLLNDGTTVCKFIE